MIEKACLASSGRNGMKRARDRPSEPGCPCFLGQHAECIIALLDGYVIDPAAIERLIELGPLRGGRCVGLEIGQ